MSMAEKSIVRQMHFEQGMSRTNIASALSRSLSSVSRLLAQKQAPRPIGHPHVFAEAKVGRMCTLLENIVDEADGKYEVTIQMVLRLARLKVTTRTALDPLHSCCYRFRGMRSKPILSPEDIKERYA